MRYNLFVLMIVLFVLTINPTLLGAQVSSDTRSAVKISINLDKQSYNADEVIRVTCEIRNVSSSTLWLQPLNVVNIHFNLYRDNTKVLPFEKVHSAGLSLEGYIELMPNQVHIVRRALDKGGYKMPEDDGEYSLCVDYKNNLASTREHELWVGKADACAPLKIKKRE
jgi:hypothetical protein